jgi:hypothetical protein
LLTKARALASQAGQQASLYSYAADAGSHMCAVVGSACRQWVGPVTRKGRIVQERLLQGTRPTGLSTQEW